MPVMTTRSTRMVSLEMPGLKSLQRQLQSAPDHVRDRLGRVVGASTFRIYNMIRTGAWRRTGKLQQAIHYRISGLTGRVTIDADAFYWHFLEYGTVKMPARPVIRPAGDAELPEFERGVLNVGRDLEQSWARSV